MADHLFRHEAGKMVSVLTGIFGIDRLQFAEDVVQESLVRAMQTWPYYGIPKNPAAWLMQTAKNLALDLIRRETLFRDKQTQIITQVEQWGVDTGEGDSPAFDNELKDDRLRLMFACCHPQLPQEAQTTLALKTLCGFGVPEIAKAFLTSEAAVAKRLTRSRQRIQELGVKFEIPEGEELNVRLDAVLQTLYLLFNEGYKASNGDKLIREDLCEEAIRQVTLLAKHPVTGQPRVYALVALMLFNAARLPARLDTGGNILRLKEQNRSLWNQAMIHSGLRYFAESATGEAMSVYHLQAAIAACHCTAPDYESTNWGQILLMYDQLMLLDNSPVIALNRAVVIAQLHGPRAGIEAVQAIADLESLDSYYLLYATLGEFQFLLGDLTAAAEHFSKATRLTDIGTEQFFLNQRLQDCEVR